MYKKYNKYTIECIINYINIFNKLYKLYEYLINYMNKRIVRKAEISIDWINEKKRDSARNSDYNEL